MGRFSKYLLLLLLSVPGMAWGQLYVRMSPQYVGTGVDLPIRITQWDQYNIVLAASTRIVFQLPTITGAVVFRLNVCEDSVGGYTPTFSAAAPSSATFVQNAQPMLSTDANACTVEFWTFRQTANQAVLEYTSPSTLKNSSLNPVNINGVLNPVIYGAVPVTGALPTGSITNTAGGNKTLTLSSAISGQPASGTNVYVGVIGAGASTALTTPSAPTDAGSACAGSCATSYALKQVDIDAQAGMTTHGAAFSFANDATLSLSGGSFLKVNPSVQAGTAQHAYYLSRDNGNTYTLWGCFPDATVPLYIGSNAAPLAYGCPDFVPSTLPSAATPQMLVSQVAAGGGTSVLTLVTGASNTATAQKVYPLSGQAINATSTAAGTGGSLYFPAGTYYTSQQIVMGQDQHWNGQEVNFTTIKAVNQITSGPMFDMVRTTSGQLGRTLKHFQIDGNNIAGGLRNVDNQMLMENVRVTGSQIGPGLELKGTQNSTLVNVTVRYSLNGALYSYNPTLGICANSNKMIRSELQTVSGYALALISPGTGSQACLQNSFDSDIIGDFPFAPHYRDLTTDAGANIPKAMVVLVNATRNVFSEGTSIFGNTTTNDLTLDTEVAVGCTNCISGGYDTVGTSNWFNNVDFSGVTGFAYTNVPAFINHEVKTYISYSGFAGWGTNPIIVSDRLMNVQMPVNAYYAGAVTDTGAANQKVSWGPENNLAGSGIGIPLGDLTLSSGSINVPSGNVSLTAGTLTLAARADPLKIPGATSGTATVHPPAAAGTADLTLPAANTVMLSDCVGTTTYGTTVTPSLATNCRAYHVTITDGVGWTLAAPTNTQIGQTWYLDISNTSGGAGGTITPGAGWTSDATLAAPANGKAKLCTVLDYAGGAIWRITCSGDLTPH